MKEPSTLRTTSVMRAIAVLAAVVIGLLWPACTTSSDRPRPAAAPVTTAGSQTTTTRPVNINGKMALDPAKGPAGTSVRVDGRDLPANLPLRLIWVTHDCRWVLKGAQSEEYHGRQCDVVEVELASVRTDAQGAVSTSFVVPEDFGFAHDVLLVDKDGAVRNKALFDAKLQVTVAPDSGPVGTPITITVKGMGVEALENNRQILYDNGYTGWLSAITTRGTATATIPATGAPGRHVIQVARGAFTFPYLNPAQSPRPDIPVFEFPFTVTDGPPVLPAPGPAQTPPAVARSGPAGDSNPAITTDLAAGPVGTLLTLKGQGFAATSDVKVQWFRIVGNRVAGQGWEERSVDLPPARTAGDGTFVTSFAIPGDVGGPHRIEASLAGGRPATTSVVVTPAAAVLAPAAGPQGTSFNATLTGVGWTETANIYTVVYDNRYIGYACGFNSQGNVTVPMTATGEPGWHFIDLYPAIYKGEEGGGQQSFRIPQLTFAADHPGERLPAFHFAFQITG